MQSTSTIAMVRPAAFGFNEETAVNNFFQDASQKNNLSLQQSALKEFDAMVAMLQKNNIDVIVLNDTLEPAKPDAVFPNNWFSCRNGEITIFPMFAKNRRQERRTELVEEIKSKTGITKINDWSCYENDDQFLEGTGSIVFDHENCMAYACISSRTDENMFVKYAGQMNYKPISFMASDEAGNEIYHTNVLMCIGSGYAIICTDAIKNETEKEMVTGELKKTGHQVIDISFHQVRNFAGNMLQLLSKDGKQYLLMSKTAHNSLLPDQINDLENFSTLITPDVSVIEKASGGSVRCMVAEIFKG